jgi:hypothetical protein
MKKLKKKLKKKITGRDTFSHQKEDPTINK